MKRILIVGIATIALSVAGCYGIRSVQQRVEEAYVWANAGPIEFLPPYPVYAHSVVPGGIHSPMDFEASQRDPVVKAHYASIGKLMNLQQAPGDYYDSYRIGNAVYWTSYRVHVPASEALWVTENGELVRPRCGNRLSLLLPMQPTLPARLEPKPEEFDDVMPENTQAPVDSEIIPYVPDQALSTPESIASAAPVLAAPVAAILPGGAFVPGFIAAAPSAVAVEDAAVLPSPTEAPEPSSWWLGLFGMAGVAYVQWRNRQ